MTSLKGWLSVKYIVSCQDITKMQPIFVFHTGFCYIFKYSVIKKLIGDRCENASYDI